MSLNKNVKAYTHAIAINCRNNEIGYFNKLFCLKKYFGRYRRHCSYHNCFFFFVSSELREGVDCWCYPFFDKLNKHYLKNKCSFIRIWNWKRTYLDAFRAKFSKQRTTIWRKTAVLPIRAGLPLMMKRLLRNSLCEMRISFVF